MRNPFKKSKKETSPSWDREAAMDRYFFCFIGFVGFIGFNGFIGLIGLIGFIGLCSVLKLHSFVG